MTLRVACGRLIVPACLLLALAFGAADAVAAPRAADFGPEVALAEPSGDLPLVVEGEARGTILDAPRGASGFGYDPLFAFSEPGLPQTGRTFAELAGPEKSAVSHRGRALRTLARSLPALLGAAL